MLEECAEKSKAETKYHELFAVVCENLWRRVKDMLDDRGSPKEVGYEHVGTNEKDHPSAVYDATKKVSAHAKEYMDEPDEEGYFEHEVTFEDFGEDRP